MKRLWLLTLVSIVTLALAASGQDAKQSTMRGASRSAPPPSATLVVGINANVGTVAEPGWPLIVTATNNNTPPVPSLPSDLRLKMTMKTGGPVALNFEPITPPPSSAVEPARYWVAAESETSRLASGRYRIALEFGTPGWRLETGEIQILPAKRESWPFVVVEDSTLSIARPRRRRTRRGRPRLSRTLTIFRHGSRRATS